MKIRATTICAVRRNGQTAIAGDGQVSIGDTIFKNRAHKLRTMQDGAIIAGYAGAAADALALFERLEGKLREFGGNLQRAIVELAKDWRTDRMLRRLEALMIVCDRDNMFLISGTGDIITPDGDILAIGSGGPYAQAAATALLAHTELSAEQIVRISLEIAAEICLYTNDNISVEVLQ